jgi:anaphase-promoting complex subunit 1
VKSCGLVECNNIEKLSMVPTVPLVKIRGDWPEKYSDTTLKPETARPINAEYLHLHNNEVYWIRGGTVIRQFSYSGETVVAAEFAVFEDDVQDSVNDDAKAAVVFLADMVYIYKLNGMSHNINMPFQVKRVFQCEKGLVVERDLLSDEGNNPSITCPKFFTMTDPILELGLIISSSTSAISPAEQMVYFAPNNKSSICVTLNPGAQTICLYHIRYLARNKFKAIPTRRRSSSSRKRCSTFAGWHLEDSGGEGDTTSNLERRLSLPRPEMPVTADRRTSLEPFSEMNYDSPIPTLDTLTMRKDVILTQIESLVSNVSKSDDLKVVSFTNEGVDALCVLNKVESKVVTYFLRKASGPVGIPTKEETQFMNVRDMGIITTESSDFLLVLSGDGSHYLLDPFTGLKSPKLSISELWGAPRSIHSTCRNMALIETEAGFHQFEVPLDARDELTNKCLQAFNLLDPLNYGRLRFIWTSAVSKDRLLREWHGMMAAVLFCLVDFEKEFLPSELSDKVDDGVSCKARAWRSFRDSDCDYSAILTALEIAWRIALSGMVSPYPMEERSHLILCLHVIREEFKLNICCRQQVSDLGLLLSWITNTAGWAVDWTTYYEMKWPENIYGKICFFLQMSTD